MTTRKATWSGTINFGIVAIPVKLYSAVEDGSSVKFRQLNAETNNPIKMKKVDSVTGADVTETVKGYEINKGEFVVVTDDEIAELLPDKNSTIELMTFLDHDEIENIYFDKPYYLGTDGSDKPYKLLEQALRNKNKIAIGKVVMRSKEYLCVIKPEKDSGLSVSTLRWQNQVRSNEDITPSDVELSEAEIALAENLIEAMISDIDITEIEETYTEELKSLIEDKAAGKIITQPAAKEKEEKTDDVMAALQASLEMVNQR